MLSSFIFLEFTAVVLSIAYVVLATKASVWCWPPAFISSAIYIYIFIDAQLYFESFLNAYYVIMAIYGFYNWNKSGQSSSLAIVWSGLNSNVLIIGIGAIVSILIGFTSSYFTDASFPIIDAFTTVFSLIATWMVTQKRIENWLYFIVIDVISIYLYTSKELYVTSGLFVVYIVIAIFGFINWNKQLATSANSAQ
jgi:nicotinamide mononucleotide transporter